MGDGESLCNSIVALMSVAAVQLLTVRDHCGILCVYLQRTCLLAHRKELAARADDALWAEAFARIENHYFVHGEQQCVLSWRVAEQSWLALYNTT